MFLRFYTKPKTSYSHQPTQLWVDHFAKYTSIFYHVGMNVKKVKEHNDNKNHTWSGDRGKDLFPNMNVTFGKAAILSQLINDFPKGFGSLSHTFNTVKLKKRMRKKKKEFLVNADSSLISHNKKGLTSSANLNTLSLAFCCLSCTWNQRTSISQKVHKGLSPTGDPFRVSFWTTVSIWLLQSPSLLLNY